MKIIIPILFLFLTSSQLIAQDFEPVSSNPKEEVKIYPNPCKNSRVTIDYHSIDIKEIRMTNIAGKQVYFKTYNLPSPKIELKLDQIPNGIYLVQITTNDNTRTVKKLLISRN